MILRCTIAEYVLLPIPQTTFAQAQEVHHILDKVKNEKMLLKNVVMKQQFSIYLCMCPFLQGIFLLYGWRYSDTNPSKHQLPPPLLHSGKMCFLFLLEIENLQAAFYTGCHLGQGHNGRHTTTTGFDLTQFFATFLVFMAHQITVFSNFTQE